MKISGDSNNRNDFLKNLNPRKLADLTADILSYLGHSQIKIVDGPGDGGRDIHSLDKNEKKHLTQCKFHYDLKKTSSSREVGELPLAMMKLGYTNGLFCTNSKVSPQTKREFLDNFSSLELDYFEGKELVGYVFEDVVLKSLWFDGESIENVSSVIIVPAVLRELQKDKHYYIEDFKDHPVEWQLDCENQTYKILVKESNSSPNDFSEYRQPTKKTIYESWWSNINGLEFIVSGPIKRKDFESLFQKLPLFISEKISKSYLSQEQHIAIRFGRPILSTLSGKNIGVRTIIEHEPETYKWYKGNWIHEIDWLLPIQSSTLRLPNRLSSMTSDWIRYYHNILDACFDIRLNSVPGTDSMGMVEERVEYFKKWWDKSIFALIDKVHLESWEELEFPEGAQYYEAFDAKIIVFWLHNNLSEGFRKVLMDDNHEISESQIKEEQLLKEESDKLMMRLNDIGAELISPEKARYLVAYLQKDPYPISDIMTYRLIDILREYSTIPSPILPSSRIVELTICWMIVSKNIDDKILDKIEEAAISILRNGQNVKLIMDSETINGSYLLIELNLFLEEGMSTEDFLAKEQAYLSNVILKLDGIVKRFLPGAIQATQKFWNYEIGLFFD